MFWNMIPGLVLLCLSAALGSNVNLVQVPINKCQVNAQKIRCPSAKTILKFIDFKLTHHIHICPKHLMKSLAKILTGDYLDELRKQCNGFNSCILPKSHKLKFGCELCNEKFSIRFMCNTIPHNSSSVALTKKLSTNSHTKKTNTSPLLSTTTKRMSGNSSVTTTKGKGSTTVSSSSTTAATTTESRLKSSPTSKSKITSVAPSKPQKIEIKKCHTTGHVMKCLRNGEVISSIDYSTHIHCGIVGKISEQAVPPYIDRLKENCKGKSQCELQHGPKLLSIANVLCSVCKLDLHLTYTCRPPGESSGSSTAAMMPSTGKPGSTMAPGSSSQQRYTVTIKNCMTSGQSINCPKKAVVQNISYEQHSTCGSLATNYGGSFLLHVGTYIDELKSTCSSKSTCSLPPFPTTSVVTTACKLCRFRIKLSYSCGKVTPAAEANKPTDQETTKPSGKATKNQGSKSSRTTKKQVKAPAALVSTKSPPLDSSDDDSDGFFIAAAVIGIIAVLAITVFAAFCILKKKKIPIPYLELSPDRSPTGV